MDTPALLGKLRTAVDGSREEVVALCADLVTAPSVNPPGDTRQVAGVAHRFLSSHGLAAELVAANPNMPSVLASLQGAGPGRHLILNVHLDTMEPGDPGLWSVPLFELTRRGGRLYGLGVGNMKGAVAAMSMAFALLAQCRSEWPGRVTFTAVSDECVFGENGAAYLLSDRPSEVVGDALICGEGPGFMRIALAEKGVAWFEIMTVGTGGHASRVQRGESASVRLAVAISAIDTLNGTTGEPPSLSDLRGGDLDGLRLSANVGTIAGGTFVSQIATQARAAVDFRLPPGTALADVEATLSSLLGGMPGVSWRMTRGWEPNWTAADDPFVRTFLLAARDVRGEEVTPTVRLPASDASRWRALGVPAVCYGPQPTLSAGVDDYVEERDLMDCAEIYAAAAIRYLRSSLPSSV